MTDKLHFDFNEHNKGNKYSEPIAIIGLGALFPNGNGLRNFWETIINKVNTITDIPVDHWSSSAYYDPNPKAKDKTYSNKGAFLSPISFNPLKYGIPPKNLSAIDSTQLLGLVAATQALENAGYGEDNSYNHSKTSVILGVTGALKSVVSLGSRMAYPQIKKALLNNAVAEEDIEPILESYLNEFPEWQENSFPGLLGNVSAGRISNRLNLGGTNMVVDAACGSSLAAIRQSVVELQSGLSDMVVSGGLDTFSDYFMYTCFSKTPALSPSGKISSYDENGDGTMLGEGLGVVILKRLSTAKKDGDRIYAIIKGIGASSDGKGSAIFAPNAKGQQIAIERCYQNAKISPETIELIEGHGTGTTVGDAIEIEALQNVYNKDITKPYPWAALGSVKSQIGHTKAAAGVAGLIKSTLALYHKILPPTINITKPNSALNINNSAIYLNTETRPWLSNPQHPRRAAISAFGFGGTNFHCVLEEYQSFKPQVSRISEKFMLPFSSNNIIDIIKGLVETADSKTLEEAEILTKEKQARFNHKEKYRLVIIAQNLNHLKETSKKIKNLLAEKELTNHTDKNWPTNVYYSDKIENNKLGYIFTSENSFSQDLISYYSLFSPAFLNSLNNFNLLPKHNLGHLLFTPQFLPKNYLKTVTEFKKTEVATRLQNTAVNYGICKMLSKFGVKHDFSLGDDYANLSAMLTANWVEPENLFNYIYNNNLDKNKLKKDLEIIINGKKVNSIDDLMDNLIAKDNLKNSLKFLQKQENTYYLEIGSHNNLKKILKDKVISFPIGEDAPKTDSLAIVLAQLAVLGFPINFTNWPKKYLKKNTTDEFTVSLTGANYFEKNTTLKNKNYTKSDMDNNSTKNILQVIEKISNDTTRIHQEFLNTQNNTLALLQTLALGKNDDIKQSSTLDTPTATKEPIVTCIKSSDSISVNVPEKNENIKQSELKNYKQILLRIISQETGYPEEMLNLDMNLENDLGLDSIKRVEVMAALSEELPEISNFISHQLETATTINSLLEILKQVSDNKNAETTAEVNNATSKKTEIATHKENNLWNIVKEVISQETGYPNEMLNEEMNLTNDLGLDSIKKVEIMAALAEKLPKTNSIYPDALDDNSSIKDLLLAINQEEKKVIKPAIEVQATEDEKINTSKIVYKVIATETGYPQDFLKPEMHLENDLGLDSIKRVEIMAALTENLKDSSYSLNSNSLENFTTLEDILNALSVSSDNKIQIEDKKKEKNLDIKEFKTEKLILLEPQLENYSLDKLKDREEKFGTIWLITNFDSELEKKLFKQLKKDQYEIETIPWDIDSHKSLDLLKTPDTIIFSWPKHRPNNLFKAFEILNILSNKNIKPKLIIGLSYLGGYFGFNNKKIKSDNVNPISANLIGFLKCAALEWLETEFKIIDLPFSLQKNNKSIDVNNLLKTLLLILTKKTELEVALSSTNKVNKIVLTPYLINKNKENSTLANGDTILVTGGVRGITANAIIDLSTKYNLHFIIFGRTPIGPEEPEWLAKLTTDAEIKNALFEMAPGHQKLSPKELDTQSNFIKNTREIKNTINILEKNNSKVTYFECDITDNKEFTKSLQTIKEKFNNINGFIHGAGVLADKLIKDKSITDFEKVFNTKVKVTKIVLKTFQSSNFKLLAFFSSSTARFGRIGQSDYAAANEVLNKMAQQFALENENAKVISINWGPWDGGMVKKNLAKIFKNEGINLIPADAGAKLFTKLINQNLTEPIEYVVLGPETDVSKL